MSEEEKRKKGEEEKEKKAEKRRKKTYRDPIRYRKWKKRKEEIEKVTKETHKELTELFRRVARKRATLPIEEEEADKDAAEKVRRCIAPEEVVARRRGVRCSVVGRVDDIYVYVCKYSYNFFILFPLYLQAVHKLFISKSGIVALRPRYGTAMVLEYATSAEFLTKLTEYKDLPTVKDTFWFRDHIYIITPDPLFIKWVFQMRERRYVPGDVYGNLPVKLVTAFLDLHGYGKLPELINTLTTALSKHEGEREEAKEEGEEEEEEEEELGGLGG